MMNEEGAVRPKKERLDRRRSEEGAVVNGYKPAPEGLSQARRSGRSGPSPIFAIRIRKRDWEGTATQPQQGATRHVAGFQPPGERLHGRAQQVQQRCPLFWLAGGAEFVFGRAHEALACLVDLKCADVRASNQGTAETLISAPTMPASPQSKRGGSR